MVKTYDGTASEEYMESVHVGLGDLAAKAIAGSGHGSGTSTYFDDIAVLFDLDKDDEEDIDSLLAILGYGKYNNSEGGEDDMDVDGS